MPFAVLKLELLIFTLPIVEVESNTLLESILVIQFHSCQVY